MAVFSKGLARGKLCALYFLNTYADDIDMHTLCRIMHDNSWVTYLEMHGCVASLEVLGMVAAAPRLFGQSYLITDSGRETIATFKEQLPLSLRTEMNNFISENRMQLKRATQYLVERDRHEDGSYTVTLTVAEQDTILYRLVLYINNYEESKKIEEGWEKTAPVIFKLLLNHLLSDKAIDDKNCAIDDAYAKYLESAELYTSIKPVYDGTYSAVVGASIAQNSDYLRIEIRVPMQDIAQATCERWSKSWRPIYSSIINTLLGYHKHN